MKNLTLTSVLSLTLAATLPTQGRADLKDVIIGGAIGAIIVDQAHKNKNKKRSTRSTTQRRAAPATLNSQYTRAEKRQIQTALNGLGYNVGVVDGSLGRNSRSGIAQFQSARGEAATGQLTRTQYSALIASMSNPSAAFVVDRQLNRDEIVLMQTGLQQMGFYTQRIDGQKGPGTRGARDAFLRSQGYNPTTTTQVQAAVLVANTAGLFVPPYLMQEAQTQYQMANAPAPAQQPFGQAQPRQATINAPSQPQQGIFANTPVPQQQPGTQLFGTPQQPQQQPAGQLFGGTQPQQPAPQGNNLFAQPQQPAQGVQVFATPGQQQQQQGFAPAPQAPNVNPLFAAPQPQPQGVQPQGQQAPAAGLFGAPQPQQPQVQQPAQQGQGAGLFAQQALPQGQVAPQPASAFSFSAPQGQQPAASGLDIFTPAPQGN